MSLHNLQCFVAGVYKDGQKKKKHLKTSSNFLPSFQNFIQNWENVIKIGRVGGKT